MGTSALNIGVIGAGRIGKVHAESVATWVPGARLAGVADIDLAAARSHVHFAADGVHSATPLHFFLERYLDAYVAEIREFVRCIQTGTTPPVTGRDGLVPVIMGLAATRSLREGRPVKLDEIR